MFSYLKNLYFRENLPSHFKFKEYCPQVFRNLRDRFGIDDQDYLVSLLQGEGSPGDWKVLGIVMFGDLKASSNRALYLFVVMASSKI